MTGSRPSAADRQEVERRDRHPAGRAVLGIWIGAVTFTGSVIAYGKLAGKVAFAVSGGHSGEGNCPAGTAERGGSALSVLLLISIWGRAAPGRWFC
jgi:hypothetical protein